MTAAAVGWPALAAPAPAPAPAPKGRPPMPQTDVILSALATPILGGIAWVAGKLWGARRERADITATVVSTAGGLVDRLSVQLDRALARVEALEHADATKDAQIQGLEQEVHVLRKDRVSDRAALELLRQWAFAMVATSARNSARLEQLGGRPEPLPDMPAAAHGPVPTTSVTTTTTTTTTPEV